MFFIKKQFKNIISWGIISFCFFAGFGLLFYSFFIIYPLDQISETESENTNLITGADVNVITKPLNNVKINVGTESELQENNESLKSRLGTPMTIGAKKNTLLNNDKTNLTGQAKTEFVGATLAVAQNKKIKKPKAKPEIGMASWYCPKWCEKLAAAHPNFSKGTKLKVTNLENKKSVIVIVNDFGPNKSIHPDRIIDLTKTAFQKIANIQKGTIKVQVEKQ
ncbi:MAG: septal ring lytic transglycosylase RlpA family protein [Candidatus Kuenenbacteria bacterium]